nr:CRISPR-associated primase-polymerase type A1 [uncultured Desulfobulbus sp.]
MNGQQAVSETFVSTGADHRLLLDRLGKAAFDEAGQSFVQRALNAAPFWGDFTDTDIQHLAIIAQQHGLFTESGQVLAWLNQQQPECLQGWQAHLELLETLGKEKEALQLKAKARRFHPQAFAVTLQLAEQPVASQDEDHLFDPFLQLRRCQEETAAFMRLFQGREDAFARQWADREEQKKGYVPVKRALLPEDVQEHLQGRKTYGIYLLNGESEVFTGVIDVDLVARLRDRREATKEKESIRRESTYIYTRLMELAKKAGLTCIAEVSGGKGYHFWFPLARPVPAATVRQGLQSLLAGVAADVRCFNLELFPKQDQRTGKGFGNLVKLPLGVHRVTGKKSYFIGAKGQTLEQQLAWLTMQQPADPACMETLARQHRQADVVVHPKMADWAAQYPELAELSGKCSLLAQLVTMARSGREPAVREEKVLLGTLAHLERGRLLLHYLFSRSGQYNRPLLDYKISKVRGTPLGCKRIHSLLDQGFAGALPCSFSRGGYPHPLLHLSAYGPDEQPVQEQVVDLKDALLSLKTAIVQVERFLTP